MKHCLLYLQKPTVVVHEQKPVIKIKNPTPSTTTAKKSESRKKSEKNDSRNQKRRILPSEKAPLKLKISKNKEVENEKSLENLKLVVSNGKIVRYSMVTAVVFPGAAIYIF